MNVPIEKDKENYYCIVNASGTVHKSGYIPIGNVLIYWDYIKI